MFGRISERILFSPEYLSLLIVQFELIEIFANTVSVVVEYSQVVTGSGMTLVTPSRKKGDGRGVVLFNSHTCRQGVSRLNGGITVFWVDGGIKVIWGYGGINVIWGEIRVSILSWEKWDIYVFRGEMGVLVIWGETRRDRSTKIICF